MAFPDGWGYRWPIAINADSVITSPVSTWPCLITDVHFPAGAWAQMNGDASDLRFSSDEAGASELYYDAPRISVAGQSAHLYVQVPTLLNTQDTTIYAWVGKSDATAPSAAWMQSTYPADWAGFWPMEEGTGLTVSDRTANARHGTLTNMDPGTDWVQAADGSWSLDFDGNDDYVNVPAADDDFLGAITIIWRGTIDTGSAYRHFAGKHTGNGGKANPFDFRTDSAPVPVPVLVRAGTREHVVWSSKEQVLLQSAATYGVTAASPIETAPTFYRNGVAGAAPTQRAQTPGTGPPTGSGADIRMGVRSDNAVKMDGRCESVTIVSRELTADENAIHHLMLSAPATWASAGELVAVGGGAVPMIYRAARRRSRTLIPGMVVIL